MNTLNIGVISDTHGLLRPQAVSTLQGVDLILHAGDVGEPEILEELRQIAPVQAVRGNIDRGLWAQSLPYTLTIQAGEVVLYLLHSLADLDLKPEAAGFGAVIYGHSHRPAVAWKQGVLYLNPGSIGPRRFRLPASLALLSVRGSQLEPKLVEIE